MHKPSFAICPEGASAIGFTAFSAIFFAVLDMWIPALIFWVLCWFSLHFFRDPSRVIPSGKNIAVSPADGTIIRIEDRTHPFDGQTSLCISIFMSVFNVHVNRTPVACRVCEIKYYPGRFFNASLDKASLDNERCAWLLEDKNGTSWAMVQIAGLIARRIVCRAREGDELNRGQRIGMIRFGSRVDLYLPQGYSPTVKLKDKVFGGQTVIASKD